MELRMVIFKTTSIIYHTQFSGVLIIFKDWHPSNTDCPMNFTVLGIFNSRRFLQSVNAPFPIHINPSGSVILDKDVQPLNAESSISVMVLQSSTDSSRVQFMNAHGPIVVASFSTITLRTFDLNLSGISGTSSVMYVDVASSYLCNMLPLSHV